MRNSHALNSGRLRGIVNVRANLRGSPQASAEAVFADLKHTVEDFKQDHRKQLGDLSKDMERLSADVSALRIGGSAGTAVTNRPVLEGFAALVRRGDTSVFAARRMTTQSDPDGGFTVPPEMDTLIYRYMQDFSPLRRLASVVTSSSSEISFLKSEGGTGAGWVGEEEDRDEKDSPQLSLVTVPAGEIYAEPVITQKLLDDSAFNIDTWVREEIAETFALQESSAFITGNGINRPRGILTYDFATTGDATRSRSAWQYLPSGNASNFAATNSGDILIDLVYKLKGGYRAAPGTAWLMNSATAATVRKFKDGQGNYLWSDSVVAGQPPLLLGFPVEIDENMPDIAAGAYPVAFGCWSKAYKIVDRMGFRLLRDPYTRKGFVKFYATKRVGAGAFDLRAAKFLKIGTS